MSEHTEAGKAFIARVVYRLVPPIERDFWRDDQNKGDTIQHFCFFLAGKPNVYRLAFMTSSLDECADPRNTNVRHHVEQYIRQKVSALLQR
jgi:hypothetical protein